MSTHSIVDRGAAHVIDYYLHLARLTIPWRGRQSTLPDFDLDLESREGWGYQPGGPWR